MRLYRIDRAIPALVSHLFFLFFTCPIFSPYISGHTIYLYWLMPALDINFLRFAVERGRRLHAGQFLAFAALTLWLSSVDPVSGLRWALLIWTLSYLQYTWISDLFYLRGWIQLNVGVALAQAILFFTVGVGASLAIGPTAVSHLIWGDYATQTFSNFSSIIPFLPLPRFSGFSREGGFFASLLVITSLLCLKDGKRIGPIIWLGLLLSLSKTTALLPIGWMILRLSRRLGSIPTQYFGVFLLAFFAAFGLWASQSLIAHSFSETFTHRFFPYAAVVDDFSIPGLLLGQLFDPQGMEHTEAYHACLAIMTPPTLCYEFPSFASLLISAGIVGMSLYLFQLKMLNIDFWGVSAIFVLSSDVSPLTETSFVVCIYLFAMNLALRRSARLDLGESSGIAPPTMAESSG